MNPYEVLGVPRSATDAEIKKAYRRLALETHPDRNPGDESATERFKEIQAAHDILGHPDKKAEYDMYGSMGDAPRGPQGKPFNSVFNDFFNNMFNQGAQRQVNGAHIQIECPLDLEEVLVGGTKEVKYERARLCETCRGSGGEEVVCEHCEGKGTKVIHGQAMTVKTTCHACEGRGKVVGESCQDCTDGFMEPEEDTATFNFPKGVESGMRFVFRGKGHPSPDPDGQPGNLYVIAAVRPHEFFERLPHGNVLLEVPVTYTQLVLGHEMEVPTLHGKVQFKIPPGTQSDTKFRLKEQGLPTFKDRRALYSIGDQIVEVRLEVPKDLSEEQKKIIEELAQLEQGE